MYFFLGEVEDLALGDRLEYSMDTQPTAHLER